MDKTSEVIDSHTMCSCFLVTMVTQVIAFGTRKTYFQELFVQLCLDGTLELGCGLSLFPKAVMHGHKNTFRRSKTISFHSVLHRGEKKQ